MFKRRVAIVVLTVFFSTSSVFSGSSKGSDLWKDADYKVGEIVYAKNCAFCHSKNGDGKNWIGSFIVPHPRNFTDLNVMKGIDRKRMFNSILKGRPGTSMPTWEGLLTGKEIRSVVLFIEKRFVPR